jgi:predicted hydrolase (HD superfamily)
MDRPEAISLIKAHVKKDFLLKHMLATEAIMKGLARELGKDEGVWAMTGLVHDVDFEECKRDWSDHGVLSMKLLEGKLEAEGLHAIQAHNYERTGVQPQSDLDWALLSADAITGLIVAATLVKPDKKLASVTVESVKNAFKKKGFAAGSNREHIGLCEKLGLSLDRFIELSLGAMQAICQDLGL